MTPPFKVCHFHFLVFHLHRNEHVPLLVRQEKHSSCLNIQLTNMLTPFYILHVIPLWYENGLEVGIPVVYTIKHWRLFQHQLHVRKSSEPVHFSWGGRSRSRVWQRQFFIFFLLSRRFRGHASRSGKRQSDEHIIQRTSLLTMPIYFDNQFTIVPVKLLKGQWFIRIDQFWVTSCAALWGQTEAWLAVQSGMLSNARAWLTAHQHAELNSRTQGKKQNKTKKPASPFSPWHRTLI